jgi:CHAD domain-containing protein
VREAALRCAREQLDEAVRQLSEEIDDHPVAAVHEARKAVKKERALLRLLRGTLPSAQRTAANTALRDAARGLSGVRDADVMIETVHRLADRFAGQVPESTFTAVSQKLEETRRLEGGTTVAATLSSEAVQDLGAVLVRVDDWELRRVGWTALEDGLLRGYRRGRKAFARARKERSLESLHAWRKRVKDLWYHLRLLQPVCGRVVRGQAKEASRLADLLGEDHDLGVLSLTLDQIERDVAVDVDALRGLIDYRRDEVQSEAIFAGERLYAEKPKAFARRLHRYWKAGREEARAQHDRHPGELARVTRAVP